MRRAMLAGMVAIAILSSRPLLVAGPPQKPGDWAEYEEVVEFKESRARRVVRVTITSVHGPGLVERAVGAQSTGTVSLLTSLARSIELSRSLLDSDPRGTPKDWTAARTLDVRESKEQMILGGRSYNCDVIASNGTRGESERWDRKLWICPDISIFERAKGEVVTVTEGNPPMRFTQQLLEFGASAK